MRQQTRPLAFFAVMIVLAGCTGSGGSVDVTEVDAAARAEIGLVGRNTFGPDLLSEEQWVEFAVEACGTDEDDLAELTERYGIAQASPGGRYSFSQILFIMAPLCRERWLDD
ncbi:MAG: hypothetical protein V3V01_10245 [Acidimicrobiales bacterium]